MKCGNCKFIHIVEGQPYHDCREDSPKVVVSGFKPNPASPESTLGKIMTVWPRVSLNEVGCGKFMPTPASTEVA
jgi:hypothetical protein